MDAETRQFLEDFRKDMIQRFSRVEREVALLKNEVRLVKHEVSVLKEADLELSLHVRNHLEHSWQSLLGLPA